MLNSEGGDFSFVRIICDIEGAVLALSPSAKMYILISFFKFPISSFLSFNVAFLYIFLSRVSFALVSQWQHYDQSRQNKSKIFSIFLKQSRCS